MRRYKEALEMHWAVLSVGQGFVERCLLAYDTT